jgi:glutamate dehydrogenase (NAD(P)+)
MSQADQSLLTLNWRDPVTGARGYLALDVKLRGLAAGGCRVRPGLTIEEIARLARAMTQKFTLFEIPIGGGKCGLDYDPAAPDLPDVLARFFGAIRPFLRESYITGEDLGTNEELILATLARVGLETTADSAINTWNTSPEVIKSIPDALRLDVGGMTLASIIAGYGTAQCALEALERLGPSPQEARASVQGFGSVGGAAARFLHEEGVKIVAIADAEGTVANPNGLDVSHLLAKRSVLGVVDRASLPDGVELQDAGGWLRAECEVLVPAAISDAVDLEDARGLSKSLRVVSQGANLPLSDEAERHLHERGVFIVPDFLANSAFAFIFSALMLEWVGVDKDAILKLTAERLRTVTGMVLDGFEQGEFPRDAVVRVAEANEQAFLREAG